MLLNKKQKIMESKSNKNFILKIVLFAICSINVFAAKSQYYSKDIGLAVHFDNYWSDWRYADADYLKIEGSYSGFILYTKEDGPWNYRFKFTIDRYVNPDKKTKKKHRKENLWYTYTGTVEYYICDDYPSIYDVFSRHKAASFVPKVLESGRPTKKITSRATIKIAPYKNNPRTYNIWFDNVGLAISLRNGLIF